MKKVLVITYFWPPASGGGVQRAAKFCKYLGEFGYEPIVVTGTPNSGFPEPDGSFDRDVRGIRVHRVPMWFDPARWLSSPRSATTAPAHARSGNGNQRRDHPSSAKGWKTRLLSFLWLNLFIPDSKIAWYLPAYRRIRRILKTEHIDAVITSCPPYTTHLLGLRINKEFQLPWLTDFRDPWVENVHYNVAYRFPFVVAINRALERRVLHGSDAIETVGPGCARILQSKIDTKKVTVIYNGYDPDDFKKNQPRPSSVFRLGYYGSMHQQQIPLRFIHRLSQVLREGGDFAKALRLEVSGPLAPAARRCLESSIPRTNLEMNRGIPHARLAERLQEEQVLLLLINDMRLNELILTGKLFEYLHAGWPILCIGPVDGDAARLVERSASGMTFEHLEPAQHVEYLLGLFRKWKEGGLEQRRVCDPLFDRREQAGSLSLILDQITNGVRK